MITKKEYDEKGFVLRYDFSYCPYCKGIVHINDNRCRWCGSKKKKIRVSWNFKRALFFMVIFLVCYILGRINISELLSIPLIAIIAYFSGRGNILKWHKRNIF